MANEATPGTTKPKLPAQVKYCASLYPKKVALPKTLVSFVKAIEDHFLMKVVMLLQDDEDDSDLDAISPELFEAISNLTLPSEPVILLIHSLGGRADSAYQIVLSLRQKCGSFKSFVPVHAKSAATLIAMGGTSIIMPPLAHLGPIDAQVFDHDIGGRKSALEVVQAVDRLRSEAMDTLKQSVMAMYMGTRLPFTTLLPHAVQLTCGLMEPLLNHVDVNQYMRMSRSMKVGEEYATRILSAVYGQRSSDIARSFSQDYPEHGFVICAEEAGESLNVEELPIELAAALAGARPIIGQRTAIGLLEEFKDKQNAQT